MSLARAAPPPGSRPPPPPTGPALSPAPSPAPPPRAPRAPDRAEATLTASGASIDARAAPPRSKKGFAAGPAHRVGSPS